MKLALALAFLGGFGGLVGLKQGACIKSNSGRWRSSWPIQSQYKYKHNNVHCLLHVGTPVSKVSSVNIIKRPRISEARIPDFVDNFHRLHIVFTVWPCHN